MSTPYPAAVRAFSVERALLLFESPPPADPCAGLQTKEFLP